MLATPFPRLIPIKRNIESPDLHDPAQSVTRQLGQFKRVRPGARIAIAVGSRGLSNLVPILQSIITWLIDSGADPFVIAAMGSHGGGTVAGQLAILHGYGVREEVLGVPVRASIDTVSFSGPLYDTEIWLTKEAWEADGIILVNRVKMHTDIQGPIQSGLCKLIAIGLGNRRQAEILHSEGLEALSQMIPRIASEVIATGKIVCGVAMLENKHGNTALVEIISPDKIVEREKELLLQAIADSSGLPVNTLDVLVVDEGGKNYAGSCIDTHVVGRMRLEVSGIWRTRSSTGWWYAIFPIMPREMRLASVWQILSRENFLKKLISGPPIRIVSRAYIRNVADCPLSWRVLKAHCRQLLIPAGIPQDCHRES